MIDGDDELDQALDNTYPRVCECCHAADPGSYDLAIQIGWRLGWDGWICVDCLREDRVH